MSDIHYIQVPHPMAWTIVEGAPQAISPLAAPPFELEICSKALLQEESLERHAEMLVQFTQIQDVRNSAATIVWALEDYIRKNAVHSYEKQEAMVNNPALLQEIAHGALNVGMYTGEMVAEGLLQNFCRIIFEARRHLDHWVPVGFPLESLLVKAPSAKAIFAVYDEDHRTAEVTAEEDLEENAQKNIAETFARAKKWGFCDGRCHVGVQ